MIVCMYLSLMVLGKNDCLYVSVFDGLRVRMIVCMYLSLMVLGENDCLYVSVFDGLREE